MELKKIFCIDYLPFKVTPLYRQTSKIPASNCKEFKSKNRKGLFS